LNRGKIRRNAPRTRAAYNIGQRFAGMLAVERAQHRGMMMKTKRTGKYHKLRVGERISHTSGIHGAYGAKAPAKKGKAPAKPKADIAGMKFIANNPGIVTSQALLAAAQGIAGSRKGLSYLSYHTPRGIPFPDRYFTKLRYERTNQGNKGGFGQFTNSYFYQSSLFLPDPVGGAGIYANYFTLMSDAYLEYMVHGTKFTAVSHTPDSVTGPGSRCYMWATIVPATMANWNALVPNTKAGFDEWGVNSTQYLVAPLDAATRTTYSGSIYAKTVDYYSSATDYSDFAGYTLNALNPGGTGSSPALGIYFGHTVSGPGGATLAANECYTDFILDFDVEFFDLCDVGPNTVDPPIHKTPFFTPGAPDDESDASEESVMIKVPKASLKGK